MSANFSERLRKLRNFQSQDFWAMLFARPLTILFLLPIIEFNFVTPNRITILAIITKVAATFFIAFDFSYRGAILGAVLINLGLVLDNMDGTIARYRKCGTQFGYVFDKVSDSFTLAFLFFAMGWRGYNISSNIIDLILPLAAMSGAFVSGYSKWVFQYVMKNVKLSEIKDNPEELRKYAEGNSVSTVSVAPPERTFVDWIKWFGKALFSILYMNEVDLFFWCGLSLVLSNMDIFNRYYSSVIALGVIGGPLLFSFKTYKAEKNLKEK